MAKGQIHMGKNGPEKCGVDTSKPRSRGCPYEATGHYSSVDEAMENYAVLNRVDPKELREMVADGASPRDAVGLIRSGYGTDYLAAAKKDADRVPPRTHEDESASYLEAKTQVSLRLEEAAPGLVVEGSESSQRATGIIVRKSAEQGEDGFSFVIQGEGDELSFERLSVESQSSEGNAVEERLERAISGNDSDLRSDLSQMLSGYRSMTAAELVETR